MARRIAQSLELRQALESNKKDRDCNPALYPTLRKSAIADDTPEDNEMSISCFQMTNLQYREVENTLVDNTMAFRTEPCNQNVDNAY